MSGNTFMIKGNISEILNYSENNNLPIYFTEWQIKNILKAIDGDAFLNFIAPFNEIIIIPMQWFKKHPKSLQNNKLLIGRG
jgi:hypothetical protein